jgi:PAS domain S-box-containing protein
MGLDIQGTVGLILKMLPKTRKILIISGSSLIDRAVQNLAREALRGYSNRLEINYLAEITTEDLMDKVARLPERSVIFYLLFSRDSEGKSFVPREIMSDISKKTNAPMFGIVDTYLGYGIVGGSLLSAAVQGKRCAEIALQILGGQSPTEIPPEQTLNQLMFDWRQLKRWDISEDKLPAGSIVRYRTFSSWEQYRWHIIGIIAFIFIESFLIIILWIQITKRRKEEIKIRKSEVMYRTVADYTYAWEYWAAFDGTLYYVSPSCERISGYTAQEFVANPSLMREIIVPEDRGIWDKHYRNSREELSKQEFEFRIQRRDGEIRWIDHVCQPAYDDQGNHVGFRAGNRDTTDHKRADEALKRSEARLAEAQRTAHLGGWEWDIVKHELHWSVELYRIFDVDPDEVKLSKAVFIECVHPDDRPYLEECIAAVLSNKEPLSVDYRITLSSGTIRFLHSDVRMECDAANKPVRLVGIAQDITERKQAENALREREKRFSDIADNALVWIWETNADGKYVFASPVVKKILGYEPEEVLDKHFYDLFHPEDREELRKAAFEVFARREPFCEFVNRNTHKSGKEVWLSTSAVPMFDEEGNIMGYRGSDTDITDRKRAEDELLLKDLVFEHSITANSIADNAGIITHVNDTFIRIWGYESRNEAIGKPISDFLRFEDEAKKIITALDETGKWEGEHTALRKDGTTFSAHGLATIIIDESGDIIGYQSAVLDITKRKQMEKKSQLLQEELAHASRVLSMGEIAASLAHEINQPLTAIRSYAQAAQRLIVHDTPNLDEVGKILTGIVAGNRRAEEVIQRIRMVMKNEQFERSCADLKKLIKEMVSFVRRNAEEHKISLRIDLDAEIPQVFGDRIRLQQVVLNLLLNGLEAINAGGDGFRELVVRAWKDEPDVVTISVQDSGTGVDEKNKDRIFDSFFSTKPQGMGMGLSISRSIIEDHGGRLWVTQNPVQGATFSFTVPIHKEDLR